MTGDQRRNRRAVLASLGTGAVASVAGCLGDDDGVSSGNPTYERGEVGNVTNGSRNASETSAAGQLAQSEPNTNVTPLDSLSIASHEFVIEDGFRGATVQGTVENDREERVEIAEVRARFYTDGGEQLGLYTDTVGDLDAGESWQFMVVVLLSPSDIAEYDVAALGTPAS
ncbi:FxLYD domain-containing protein [Natronococcus jeotgali]|uniref:Uncharacterized protein n=1 Tax=Natronococcus jeotgali DSM 18795 TaxID=1227498 RepID=L9WLZ7_9EURY|nr:FxLYD domain-containing protein [Natronococcus jeotgali]ELY50484.1 hypothetical protein C492_21952 [Natronococcus jeotgali DSM 18795]